MATNNSINANIPIPVSSGGTGLSSGTSGGIPYYSASNAVTSSAALGLNQVVVGGGAGSSPTSSSTFTYNSSTAQGIISSSAITPYLKVSTTNTSNGNESGLSLDRGLVSTGYAQIHLSSAGVEDWAIGTRAGTQNLSFFNTSASVAPYNFSKATAKYEITVYSNVVGSLNESAVTVSRGDQANGYSSVYFQTAGATNWIIQQTAGNTGLNVYSAAAGGIAATFSQSGSTVCLRQPKTCAFTAISNSAQSNVTGDGTVYTVLFGNKTTDQTNSLNAATGIFTAPVGGNYEFIATVAMQSIGAGHTQFLAWFLINGTTYIRSQGNAANMRSISNQLTVDFNFQIFLNAGETAQVQIEVDNSTKTVSILNSNQTTFCGSYLN